MRASDSCLSDVGIERDGSLSQMGFKKAPSRLDSMRACTWLSKRRPGFFPTITWPLDPATSPDILQCSRPAPALDLLIRSCTCTVPRTAHRPTARPPRPRCTARQRWPALLRLAHPVFATRRRCQGLKRPPTLQRASQPSQKLHRSR